MAYTDRELLARLIQCEAGGEGEDGMRAVASVIVNRARVPYGEFFRVSQGGDVRSIMEQQGQFVCMRDSVNGRYNPQNVWNMDPEDIHYEIADWALAGNTLNAVGKACSSLIPIAQSAQRISHPAGSASCSTGSITIVFIRPHRNMQRLRLFCR